MKKNKTIFIILCALIIISGSLYVSNEFFFGQSSQNAIASLDNKEGDKNYVTIEEGKVDIESINEGGKVFAHYSSLDNYDSLTDLRKAANLIIRGKVIDEKEVNDMVVASTVEVQSTQLGTQHEQVIIYQMGQLDDDSNILEMDQEYILFLNKQHNDEPNSYYIIGGGTQGKFKKEKDKLVNDDLKMKKALNKEFIGTKQFDDFSNWLNEE